MATGFTGWVFMLRGIGFKASVRPQGCDLDRLMGARLEGSETQGNRLPPSCLSSSSSYFSSHHVCTYEVFPSCRIADDAEAGDGDACLFPSRLSWHVVALLRYIFKRVRLKPFAMFQHVDFETGF